MIEVANAYGAWAITQSSSVKAASTAQDPSRSEFFAMLDQALLKREKNGQPLDKIFNKAAQTYDLPVELLKIIGWHESGFTPSATSWAGAMGVMQLMPETAKTMGVQDAYDPEQNIMAGAKLMSIFLDQYDGDLKLALAAYGAGSGAVEKYGGVPPYNEVQDYVDYVLEHLHEDLLVDGKLVEGAAPGNVSANNQADAAVSQEINNPYYDPRGIYGYVADNSLTFSKADYELFISKYLYNLQLQMLHF